MFLKILCIIIVQQIILIHFSQCYKEPRTNCTCGQVTEEDIASRILGGKILRARGHPSLALINYLGKVLCGGTVVGPRHVLTASHCVSTVYSLSSLEILLGVHDNEELDSHVRKLAVKERITHPDFLVLDKKILINDIALLVINETIKFNDFIKPICLPFNIDVAQFKAAAIAGWGHTFYGGTTQRMPRVTLLSVLTVQECQKTELHPLINHVTNMYNVSMCAYSLNKDACQGDSGGPLYVQDSKDIVFQIGIVSFGLRCGTIGFPGLYTRLTSYLNWLDTHLNGEYCRVPVSVDKQQKNKKV